MVCLCITDNTEISLGMEVAVEIGVPIHQGTIGCTPNSVPMVLIGLI